LKYNSRQRPRARSKRKFKICPKPKKRRIKKIVRLPAAINPRRELAKTVAKVKSKPEKTRIKKKGMARGIEGSTK
jgi:hypothetical protein